MIKRLLVALLLASAPSAAAAQEPVALLTGTAEQGVVLRWAWGDGERPSGWFVERRAPGASWTRLTPQPITRVRDRAVARRLLGEQFTRYEGLLFPPDPRAERRDPESFRALLLLSADVEPGVARVLGLRYDDTDARAGERYEYRLISLTGAGERVAATSGAVTAGRYAIARGPDSLRVLQGPAGFALRWQADPAFSAYHIHRGLREDGSDARRINTAPVVVFFDDAGARTESAPVFFTDSTAPRSESSWYRIEGIDAFGRSSRPSLPAAGVWRDLVAPAAPLLVQAHASSDTVIVSWLAVAHADVVAFQVWRAESNTGPFERVGRPVRGALEFRDVGRPSRQLGWYRVTAIDTAGHESRPSPLALAEVPDATAPESPRGLTGAAEVGRLAVRWQPVRSGDLLGYRVYRASTTDGMYALVTATPSRDTAYLDTIPAVADHAYNYRITAVDSAYNESGPSESLTLRPPDISPPSAPRLVTVERGDGALLLAWLASPEPDVVAYRVLYRPAGAVEWQERPDSVDRRVLADTIAGLEPGRRYQVSLVAIDDAGNRSPPAPPLRGEPARRAPAAPELRQAGWDRRARAVTLEWRPVAAGIAEVLVLRREAAGAFRPVGAPPAGATSFADRTARRGRRYEYAIQVRDAAGAVSESRPRRVDTPETP